MNNTIVGFCLFLTGAASLKGVTVTNFSDLVSVIGTGSHSAGLVIDFNDGSVSESFAWGYRWDGVASGEDMLAAIVAADPNLTVDSASFVTSLSYFDGTTMHSGLSDFGAGAISWGYYLSGGFAGDDTPGPGGTPNSILGGGVSLPTSWTLSPTGSSLVSFGESGRILTDGSWDSWSFGAFDPSTFGHLTSPGPESPMAAAAVPEPSALLLVLSAALGGTIRRKR